MADLVVTAASVVRGANANVETVVAGATVTAGQAVYKDTADSDQWKPADADASEEAAGKDGVAIALNDAADGQPLTVLKSGNINPGATVTVGTRYYVSGNAGGIAPHGDLAPSDWVTLLGVGTTASNILVKPWITGVQVP